jgi:hypothetical protein
MADLAGASKPGFALETTLMEFGSTRPVVSMMNCSFTIPWIPAALSRSG